MVRRAALLLLTPWALWPRPALAQPVALAWDAPAGCSSRTEVEQQVSRSLGGYAADAPRLAVRVVVRKMARGRVSVVLAAEGRGASGRRQLEVESCDAAAVAAALIVALMIRPAVLSTDAPPPPPPPPPPSMPPVETPAAPRARASSTPSSPQSHLAGPPSSVPPARTNPRPEPTRLELGALRDHLSARLSLAGDVGTLASADLGGELALLVSLRRLQVALAAGLYAPSTAAVASLPGKGARLGLLTVGARAGYRLPVGRLVVTPIAGAELDRETADGFGGGTNQNQIGAWLALSGGAEASWPVTHLLSITGGAEAVVPTSRPSYLASQGSAPPITLNRVSAVAGRALLGVECRFR